MWFYVPVDNYGTVNLTTLFSAGFLCAYHKREIILWPCLKSARDHVIKSCLGVAFSDITQVTSVHTLFDQLGTVILDVVNN